MASMTGIYPYRSSEMTLCEEILLTCRRELCGAYPALNGAFAYLPQQEGAILGTDGEILYVNARLISRYARDPSSVRRGYLHILLHCLFLHIQVPKELDQRDWDLACDIWVEAFLQNLEDSRLNRQDPVLDSLTHWSKPSVWDNLKALPFLPVSRAQAEATVAFDDHSLWSPDLPESILSKWQNLAGAGIDEKGGLRGSSSPNEEEAPGQKVGHNHDFHSFLQKYMIPGEEMELDTESIDPIFYHLGLERYGDTPLLEPLETKEVWRLDTLAIAIDTSASCDKALVSRFLAETYGIFSDRENFFRKMQVVFFQCDCWLQDWKIVRSPEEWFSYENTLTIKGRGGTDYTPVFRKIQELTDEGDIRQPRALLYFTDGDGVYPEKPDFETVFVLAGDNKHPELVPKWAYSLILE